MQLRPDQWLVNGYSGWVDKLRDDNALLLVENEQLANDLIDCRVEALQIIKDLTEERDKLLQPMSQTY